MVISDNSKPTINMIGGIPNSPQVNRVSGSRRPPVSMMKVRSPAGVVETHTAPNARDLIRFHGYKQASAPTIVDDHPDALRQQSMIEAMREQEEAHFAAQEEAESAGNLPEVDQSGADNSAEDPNAKALEALAALRVRYKEVTGKDAHPRMGAKKMQEEIDAAA